jgi:hypothetical protein
VNEEAKCKFLLQEHDKIWGFVTKITDERNGWLKFYWSIITASLAALGYIFFKIPSEKLPKFWAIAAAIFFALILVSMAMLMILFSLRKNSVRYRNHLNRIRGVFISKDDPELMGYLPTTPDRGFFKNDPGEKNWFGVENSILWLVAAVLSLISAAFSFSLVQAITMFPLFPVVTIGGIPLYDNKFGNSITR